jgi:hypothetical protein
VQLSCEAVDDDDDDHHHHHVWKCNQSFQFGALLKNLERGSQVPNMTIFLLGHGTLDPSEAFLIFVDGSDNLAHLRAGGGAAVHLISTLEVHTQAWRSLASGHLE